MPAETIGLSLPNVQIKVSTLSETLSSEPREHAQQQPSAPATGGVAPSSQHHDSHFKSTLPKHALLRSEPKPESNQKQIIFTIEDSQIVRSST